MKIRFPAYNSLALRLFVSAAVWSVIALVLASVILTTLYRQSVERGFDERLNVYVKTIVAALAVSDPDQPEAPRNLGEPRFELPLSGWYWQVAPADGGPILLASPSLFEGRLPLPSQEGVEPDANLTRRIYGTGPDGEALRILERDIRIGDRSYSVAVAGNIDEILKDIASFRTRVALTLSIFGVGLVMTTLFQVRYGLRPLDAIRRGLSSIRSGERDRLEGRFPSEIAPLVREMNALIQSNQEIIERSRMHVGNLAHALKTPLSVITNEARASEGPLAAKVVEQAQIMRGQVQHYLDRARMAARANVIGAAADAEAVIEAIARAMRRIYGERGIDILADVAEGARFRGEKQDLEEMVGNLFDNACKWAGSKVRVKVGVTGEEDDRRLHIVIDDDGPGLPPDRRKEALRRGERLDESVPGSGLGLSIVTELSSLYHGRLSLGESPLGGLRATLDLPAV